MIQQLVEAIIRKRVSDGNYDFTAHALERISERQIDIDKVLECILKGKSIEYQTDSRTNDIKVLFQEATDKKP